jgi:hypothetical protein
MMFNTGDLARWLEDGSLEPLGRKDDQVKIQGFRVELDGISRSIESCESVIKGCALKIDNRLWGFYSGPTEIEETRLKEAVANFQPFYAVPTVWVYLPVIKLTANGKIDKRGLREFALDMMKEPSEPPASPSTTSASLRNSSSNSSSASTYSASTEIESFPSPPLDRSLDENIDVEKAFDDSSVTVEDEAEQDKYQLPSKNGFHGWRWVRHRALSAYRKLFSVVFVANVVFLIVLLLQTRGEIISLPLPLLATLVASNLLGAVLLRQDYVINFIFWLFTRPPTSLPLWIRRHFARIYHNGGVHSGCATSATMWWAVFAVAATSNFVAQSPKYSINQITLALTYIVLVLLLAILTMAFPSIRAIMHDQFEWTHRFAGWTALALVWAHTVACTASISSEPLGTALAKTPAIYLNILITLSISLPWMRLRRVNVVPEPLSKHAVRLHFDFDTPGPSTSRGVRITDRPLVEWHAFAAIPEPSGKGFSIIVSKAGDWTKRIIENPPTSLWTRGTPASGVLAMAPLFKKIILVATGSGIGPCMPILMERRVPCRVIWSTRNPQETYGRKIIDTILSADHEAIIWDTDEKGRPNLPLLAYQSYKETGAECVCIISNSGTTSNTVYQLESRGVPAFGPIWDS